MQIAPTQAPHGRTTATTLCTMLATWQMAGRGISERRATQIIALIERRQYRAAFARIAPARGAAMQTRRHALAAAAVRA